MAELSVAEKAKQALSNLGLQEPVFDMTAQQPMLQTRSSFQTALSVIRPRNLEVVQRRCEAEAELAGDEFFYSWNQGGESIEGLSVGAALAIVRNFGNCAVEVKVTELPNSYVFDGVFVDLETGFNLVRPYRQNKQSPKTKSGKDVYSGERGIDIIFQIGTSKAIRNVVLNAVPKWITTKVIAKAKKNVVAQYEELGIEKVKGIIFRKAEAQGISRDRIEGVYGKEKVWDIETCVKIGTAIKAVTDGVEKATDLFPVISETHTAATETKVETKQPEPQQPAPQSTVITNAQLVNESTGEITDNPMAPTPEEKKELAQEEQDDRPLDETLLSQLSGLNSVLAPTAAVQNWYQTNLVAIGTLPQAKQKIVMAQFRNALTAAKARA
jgi:hypothetical protein